MTSNDENEKLDAKVLESWKVASPPSGFADGVLEKLEKIGTEETESPTASKNGFGRACAPFLSWRFCPDGFHRMAKGKTELLSPASALRKRLGNEPSQSSSLEARFLGRGNLALCTSTKRREMCFIG